MAKEIITFVDADSIAYSAGYNEYHAEMEMTIAKYINDIIGKTGCKEVVGFVEAITGKSNFRSQVAVTKPYKGSRKGRQKPPLVNDAKLHLIGKYGFKWVHSMESEDAVSISAYKHGLEHSFIAYIDKDLEQIPAKFYNYRKQELSSITPLQAHYNLYHQLIQGDSVDDITSIPGYGPKKASDVLKDVAPDDYPITVAAEFKKNGFNYQYFLEQARLIYILRYRGEVFTPVTREQWEAI